MRESEVMLSGCASLQFTRLRTTFRLRTTLLSVGLPIALLTAPASGCTPRVEVAAPDKPITINMNIKIDHEVRVKVEKDLEKEIFSEESDLF
ncbi:MAG: YnbE family lipoprotein [Bdellovibrionales bacterium]|nr:YnbE family lipoprotein [Bdellovibrionales bacterium]